MKRSLLLEALDGIERTDGINSVIQEVKKIEADKTLVKTDNKLEVYSVGCAYKAGAFIVDGEKALIYKKEFPSYYGFLTAWSN